jgi:hypothetical protein
LISQDIERDLDDLLKEIKDYIEGCYGEHYATGEIMMIDVWEKNGSLVTTARDIAMKHLDRYGKKEGSNKKDLLKTIHYCLMILQHDHGAT